MADFQMIRTLLLLIVLVWPMSLSGHKLETGQAILTLSEDRVWILELELNLSRYVYSNPELAEDIRTSFRELEGGGGLDNENFDDWVTVFTACQEQFREELVVLDSEIAVKPTALFFQSPGELPIEAYETMLVEGLHVKVFVSGILKDRNSVLQFRFPLDAGEVVLTTMQPQVQWVVTGELSAPISLISRNMNAGGGGIPVRYGVIGFKHIIPDGLDHILFVIGLFLLAAKIRPLLIQVTAFTVAHTITLGLSIYGVFSLPSNLVEPLIALSIALVAVENVVTEKIHPWRPILVFCFGLIHGLGFAGALGEIGLPQGEFLWALVSFNVGVEIGQILVVGLAFLLIGFFRNRSWYRPKLTIPISCLVGLVGLYWTIERVFFQ